VIANLRPLFSCCATPLCDGRRGSLPTVIPSHYRSGLMSQASIKAVGIDGKGFIAPMGISQAGNVVDVDACAIFITPLSKSLLCL
jgi:hypothetical protein